MQQALVNVYRTDDRLMVAAPMPGLEPENISVEITADGRLILHGELRGRLTGEKEVLSEEWVVGDYHRELELPMGVDGELTNVTYGNGVLVVVMPVAERTRPARLTLEAVEPIKGQRVGSAGHPITPTTTEEHRRAQMARQAHR
ncbi:MAG: Hsp20/alpha crystallin family protein [Chloroflexi bacterium]|nr:Hsp20/alpha crystallin family protein [Chloroflexota bacterium]